MTTAFVLSGGGSLGSVQVGMLLGLAEAGIKPDLIVGTSVGALNGAWIAGRSDHDGALALADLERVAGVALSEGTAEAARGRTEAGA